MTDIKETFKPNIVSKTEEEFKELRDFLYNLPDEVFIQIQKVEKDLSGNIFCHLKNNLGTDPSIYLPKKVYNIINHKTVIIINCGDYYLRLDGDICNGPISYHFNRHNKKSEEEMKNIKY